MELAIIIVSWNAKNHLLNCLESIRSTVGEASLQVVVVDNASTDGSPEAVERDYPRVKLMKLDLNLGFAKANNIGIRSIRAKFYALINSDVVLHPGCVETLLLFMRNRPQVGLCGPRLLNSDGSYQASCRRMISLGRHVLRAMLPMDPMTDPCYLGNRTVEVEVLAGSFLVARGTAVADVGLLDERFFFYGEDVDWSERFRAGGWPVVYHPEAIATHHGGASSAADADRASLDWHTASIQLWRKHKGPAVATLYLVVSILHQIPRMSWAAMKCLLPSKRTGAVSDLRKRQRVLGHISRQLWKGLHEL